jgi:hypothetical protein
MPMRRSVIGNPANRKSNRVRKSRGPNPANPILELEPELTFLSLIGAEIAVRYEATGFAGLNGSNANYGLQEFEIYPVSKQPFIPMPGSQSDATHTCTQRRRKLRLKSKPERTYLFMTVIKIEDPQYARTGKIGLLDREEAGFAREGEGGGGVSKR